MYCMWLFLMLFACVLLCVLSLLQVSLAKEIVGPVFVYSLKELKCVAKKTLKLTVFKHLRITCFFAEVGGLFKNGSIYADYNTTVDKVKSKTLIVMKILIIFKWEHQLIRIFIFCVKADETQWVLIVQLVKKDVWWQERSATLNIQSNQETRNGCSGSSVFNC